MQLSRLITILLVVFTGTISIIAMVRQSKRKADEFYVSSKNLKASNYVYEFSNDGRRYIKRGAVRNIEVPLDALSSSSPYVDDAPATFTQDAPPVVDGFIEDYNGATHQIQFSNSIPPVQVRTKEKAKRYENSVRQSNLTRISR